MQATAPAPYSSGATARTFLALSALLLGLNCLAAGNVIVASKGGSIKLLGDQENNSMVVTQTTPGTITITGTNGTTLTNAATGETVTELTVDIKKDLVIDTLGGDDIVTGDNIDIPGSIKIKDKLGNNCFTITDSSVGKSFSANLPGGNNEVQIVNSTISANIAIKTGNGNDLVSFQGVNSLRNAIIKANGGDDSVEIIEVNLPGGLNVDLGPGNDEFFSGDLGCGKSLSLQGGAGDDILSVNNCFGASLSGKPPVGLKRAAINAGNGGPDANDDILVSNLFMDIGTCTFIGGPGSERVLANNIINVRNLQANLGPGTNVFNLFVFVGDQVKTVFGPGNDQCFLSQAQVRGPVSVNLGSGDDLLEVGDSQLGLTDRGRARVPVFNGGSGDDIFHDEGGNSFPVPGPKVVNFETIP